MSQYASATCRALTHVSTGAGVCAARSVLRAGPGARPARPARAQPPQGPRGHQVRSPVIDITDRNDCFLLSVMRQKECLERTWN